MSDYQFEALVFSAFIVGAILGIWSSDDLAVGVLAGSATALAVCFFGLWSDVIWGHRW